MNERFYELPKEKQDRMINGAMQVFAQNDYIHASTDEMVKNSGVSKGLWFHYFGNKPGLYYYVCSYAIKYAILEFGMQFNNTTDYFDIYYEIEKMKIQFTDKYPYLPLLLVTMKRENNPEAVELIEGIRNKYKEEIKKMHLNADYSIFKNPEDSGKLGYMLETTFDSMLEKDYEGGIFSSTSYLESVKGYLNFTRRMIKGQ